MRIIISSLLLILALHFLLQGINFRKQIKLCKDLYQNKSKENFSYKKNNKHKQDKHKQDKHKQRNKHKQKNSPTQLKINIGKVKEDFDVDVRRELLNTIQCKKPLVVSSNTFVDDKNDPNFQSNVLNVNRFYSKNSGTEKPTNESPGANLQIDESQSNINSLTNGNQFSNQPEQWKYKNEFVMNGGELLNGITGYDNLSDQYSSFNCDTTDINNMGGNCSPPTRGAMVNDDLRMGMGTIGLERRSVT